ncbi:helix-turn-helix transcriptional regulator [Paenibacillus mendelii]|uniref:Helix-turn-helix transcriptional regulator n=1 Tax=Paenibacillus mendelii TaxID=206163 RepID=A0ABV6J3Q3_9BACL|nr:YafY family protein [Paenibacillus mendelii]MCQ6561950.1 YafY family transcriptional regulator [Paenibacillus mendelii]
MKLDRLLAITMLLLGRRRVSAKELSDRFEVSLRTVYRDLETINQSGIPIVSYTGVTGGYEIMDQYRLDRQFLSLEELQSIIIALRGIRFSMEEKEIGGLLDKVGALVAKSEQGAAASMSQQLLIDINPWHNGEADKEKLSVLKTAIRSTRLLRFEYTSGHGEDSERVCEPMSVVLKGYVWYLYGYCRLRQDFRIFRLSRIGRLAELPETFERREETLEQLSYPSVRPQDAPMLRLVLRFQPHLKARILDYYRGSEIEVEPEGTLLVTVVQPDEPWVRSMLLGYGTDVTVLEPASLAQELVREARKIIRKYESILT